MRSYSVPGSVRIKYEGESNRFPYSFSSDLSWQQDGESYVAKSEWSKGIPLRTRTSHGLISPDGLAPKKFTDKTRSEVAVHFDRENEKIIFSNNRPEIKLLVGSQDQLSVLIQLAALMSGNAAQFTTGSKSIASAHIITPLISLLGNTLSISLRKINAETSDRPVLNKMVASIPPRCPQ